MPKLFAMMVRTLLPIAVLAAACSPGSRDRSALGQPAPGPAPSVFAPGTVSDAHGNRDFALSPDGTLMLFTLQQRTLVSVILCAEKKQDRWSSPFVASFSGVYNDLEPAFTADGRSLYFSSNRPLIAGDSTEDYNIWRTDRLENGWSDPVALPAEVNTARDEFYPSVARNGNLYFTTQLETGKGKEDIVMCEWKDDAYLPPVSLSEAINSAGYEFNAFVDPDEQFILFTGYGRADDLGGGDLYISTNSGGAWQPAVHLPAPVNSSSIDYCPYVTPDRKYFFFTSSRAVYRAPFDHPQTIGDLRRGLDLPGNGFDDIYWMTFDGLIALAGVSIPGGSPAP